MCHLEYEPIRSPHKISVSPSPRPLHPLISSKPSHTTYGTRTLARRLFAPLIAPEEMLARAINGNLHLQQFRIVFITGIRSGILGRLDHSFTELAARRAFTSIQLRTILEENHHPFLIVERRAYERARDMAGHVAQAMKQASREATILQYAPVLDRHLEAMAELADRVFCFYDMQGQAYSHGRSISEELASQTTWEAFS